MNCAVELAVELAFVLGYPLLCLELARHQRSAAGAAA